MLEMIQLHHFTNFQQDPIVQSQDYNDQSWPKWSKWAAQMKNELPNREQQCCFCLRGRNGQRIHNKHLMGEDILVVSLQIAQQIFAVLESQTMLGRVSVLLVLSKTSRSCIYPPLIKNLESCEINRELILSNCRTPSVDGKRMSFGGVWATAHYRYSVSRWQRAFDYDLYIYKLAW